MSWTAKYSTFSVTYDGSKWSSDEDIVVTLLEGRQRASDPVMMTPTGPELEASDPNAAYPLMLEVFGTPISVTGDVPSAPVITIGAVS